MSEVSPELEHGSALSSTRATVVLTEKNVDNIKQQNQDSRTATPLSSISDLSLEVSARHGMEDEMEQSDDLLCDTTSLLSNRERSTASAQFLVACQAEEHSQQSEHSSVSSPAPSTTETLPKLRPTAPARCVVPNCCDYFTSPHPHYPKEVVGKAQKVEEPLSSSSSETNIANLEATIETVESENNNHTEDRSNHGNVNRSGQDSDEFEMWDYVCPQYARRGYANEWV
ncbi:uncharacterized protein PHALS_13374 [Plasmopara halstedii]|uniref:Uncharacterized protein n=1 Tax=Plasmopara halstedii TaxID=4781 RepID=A0A0P1APN1_PLAHL|nr:uncharacterized protein PHALS_13374 [Plasmopara halstedii]CEG43160.1 hypothetical protein PHALS_13374 [Plasmopara halstedii]|eukprot:XP_024579529.1 hypothetical protein PHALS_13374 [Plasmopara halstedii]